MKDFTLEIYRQLLQAFKTKGYTFQAMIDFVQFPINKSIIMRHDVDRKPENALKMAKLEAEMEIKATYFFRMISHTFKPGIIRKITELGHEIGYHYENLSEIASRGNFHKSEKRKVKSEKLLFKLAIEDFEKNLEKLRELYPVKSISMHGSPLSKWDSRLLWDKYEYKNYGITSEPYFDIDFNEVLYITDAGRSWSNENINRRDKVNTKYNFNFNHTNEIIKAFNNDKLPDKIMINIHPEHWAESTVEWYKVWCIRKLKNTIKKVFLRNK